MRRRTFLTKATACVVAASTINVLGHEGQSVPTEDGARYVFCFPNITSNEVLTQVKWELLSRGFKNCVVIGGQEAKDFSVHKV